MSSNEDRGMDLRALLQQAHALIDRRRFPQARQLLAGATQNYPESSQLLYLAAFVDYSEGKISEAEQTVRTVLLHDPQHYGARTLSGELHEAQRQYAQAETVWIGLLQDYPEKADCYAAYSDLMLRTLHLDKAERLMQEGLRLEPNHEKCLYIAALIQVIQGRFRGADNEHLQLLLKEHPERVRTLVALVVALEQRGDSRSALRIAQQLLSMRPDSSHFVNLVRELKLKVHWSLLPLYPMQRWGWGGAAVVTAIGLVGVRVARVSLEDSLASIVAFIWLGYVIYSWVWPRILRKLI
jgi:tetratricopeptide (TPR) repeat protein